MKYLVLLRYREPAFVVRIDFLNRKKKNGDEKKFLVSFPPKNCPQWQPNRKEEVKGHDRR